MTGGGMLCSVDSQQTTPLQLLQKQPAKLNVMEFISLKCLAVKVNTLDVFISFLKIYYFQELKKSCIHVSPEDVGDTCYNFYSLHS